MAPRGRRAPGSAGCCSKPDSEYWFNPWVKYLREEGVDFYWEKPLARLEFDGTRIISAFCAAERIQADAYILAINPSLPRRF